MFPDRLAGVACPLAVAYAVGKGGHAVQNFMHARNHILAVDENLFSLGSAQGHVQHGALFGGVDLFAGEHGVNARLESAFLGQLEQQLQRLFRDAVLRVIEVDALGFGNEFRAARRIILEQVAQMFRVDLLVMGGKRLPGWELSQRRLGGSAGEVLIGGCLNLSEICSRMSLIHLG